MLKKAILVSLIFSVCSMGSLLSTTAFAQNNAVAQRSVPKVKKGAVQAFSGRVKGFNYGLHTIDLKKGEVVVYLLKARGRQTNVNVYAPGGAPGQAEPIVSGAVQGDRGQFVVPVDGLYTFQVAQMKPDAERNKDVPYQLKIKIYRPTAQGKNTANFGKVAGNQDVKLFAKPPRPQNLKRLLAPGSVVMLKSCREIDKVQWCFVTAPDGTKGWVAGSDIVSLNTSGGE